MKYQYIEVHVKHLGKLEGKVRFEIGEGNDEYYIHRADVLSKPYLFQDKKQLKLTFIVKRVISEKQHLTEVFIPSFD